MALCADCNSRISSSVHSVVASSLPRSPNGPDRVDASKEHLELIRGGCASWARPHLPSSRQGSPGILGAKVSTSTASR
ncbi:hypothetical protein SCLCIDRAFT_22719 [Scleroderma citrinum Foug A]|uniref:Uncharacterized protein n=1 Tax=Scleroderma citrinum Foug A TaxID=1036808 RepID=A0A0C3ECA2_9AGAM|nr:hypothetical protein SCLCIDRAFT_22719 [Scleroderma citrinum Foug A]